MTNRLFASRERLFRVSVTQSLTAILCLASLYAFGVETGPQMAAASTLFVFCSLPDLQRKETGE